MYLIDGINFVKYVWGTSMKSVIIVIATLMIISGCAKQAFVDLSNAPIGKTNNINSDRVAFGDVLLLDLRSKTVNRVANLLDEQRNGQLGVQVVNEGNYTQAANSKIGITFKGNVKAIKGDITASVARSLLFEMKQTKQKRFSFPLGVLNAKEVAEFRATQAEFANNNFRFLFVNEVFTGKEFKYEFNKQKDDGGKFKIDVNGQKVEVTFNNSSGVACSGDDNACVVNVQTWKLVRNPSGATGYKFKLDSSVDAQEVFHKGL